MDILQKQLKYYANNEVLQNQFELSTLGVKEGVALTFSYQKVLYHTSINNFSINNTIQIGCLTKALTATLVAIAEMQGLLKLDSIVSDYFVGCSSYKTIKSSMKSIKFYHLLNHTSGLDSSAIEGLPKNSDDLIDLEAMLYLLESYSPVSPPGILFNYSSVGHWLAAAILEKVYKESYSNLLDEYLLKPFGVQAIRDCGNLDVCPSTGKGLCLSALDLLKITRLHLYGDPARPKLLEYLKELREKFLFPSPKWSPRGKNCYPGWYDFGESFGHLGYGKNSSAVVRFFPEYEAIITITSMHPQLANATLAKLFKNILKDFRKISSLKIMNSDEFKNIDPHIYKGEFENGKFILVIRVEADGSLLAKVFYKLNNHGASGLEFCVECAFKAFSMSYFVSLEMGQHSFPVLEFSRQQCGGRFHYVSAGGYIFSRINE